VTGSEFEGFVAERLKYLGYWALRIPRSPTGAQPFDIIALKRIGSVTSAFALDCKVISTKTQRFPLDRVEDNQWTSFEIFEKKVGGSAGLMIFLENKIYFVPNRKLVQARNSGQKSILLEDKYIWGTVM